MEIYRGVKYPSVKISANFSADSRLSELSRWAYILAELGLAPAHAEGAFGNHSYRDGERHFIVTRTGMVPGSELNENDYCRVCFNKKEKCFEIEGLHQPSSECYLHHLIYSHFPEINAIMHGHSELMIQQAAVLGIVETKEELPYGTIELADAAREAMAGGARFIMLKNHGFVSAGESMESAATDVLQKYIALIETLIPSHREKKI